MLAEPKRAPALYVDRSTRQWVVRDPEGKFWVVPVVEDAWNHREPYQPVEDSRLEPIPGHYKYLLQLPF
jgi:hypothetical protein